LSLNNVLVSFVHGYEGLLDIEEDSQLVRPAILNIKDKGESEILSYPFPRNPLDFSLIDNYIKGEPPLENAVNFDKKLPRFGLTGLDEHGEYYYAGSTNGIYEINKSDLSLNKLITHRLMMDLHGIHADEKGLIHILTCKDTIVMSDYDGNITEYFEIDRNLNVFVNNEIMETDWRFISKMHRGSCGNFHFNNVQRIGDKIWLTSRSLNCFILVDTVEKTATIKAMNFCTPALIHDGVIRDDKFYLTSVDGKIFIVEDSYGTEKTSQEAANCMHLYNRDLVAKLIRLDDKKSLGREPNWCRGMALRDDSIFTTIDGRYDTELAFSAIEINHEGEVLNSHKLQWSEVGDADKIRYVTGFDVLVTS